MNALLLLNSLEGFFFGSGKAHVVTGVALIILVGIAISLWRLDRRLEARYQWRKALAFEPTEKDRVKIEAKLLTGLGAPEKKKPKAHMPRGGTAI